MAQTGKEAKRKKLERSDNVIPDYDYLFADDGVKSKKKPNIFMRLLKVNRGTLVSTSLIYLLQAAPTWILPLVTAEIINVVTNALSTGVTDGVWRTLLICSLLIVVFVVQNVPTTMWRYHLFSRMMRRTSAGVKSSVVRKLQSLSITYHKDIETGKIQSKFLKDTEAVDGLLGNLFHSLIPNLLSVIVAIIISITKSGIISLFFLLVIPCNVALTLAFRKIVVKSHRDYRLKTENMSAKLSSMLEMMPVTKSHGLEQTEISAFRRSISQLAGSGMQVDKVTARFGSAIYVISSLLSAVCLIFCAILALTGYIEIGDVVLYQSLFTQISGHVSALANIFPAFASGMESLNSVSEIMNATDVEVNIGKPNIPKINGDVEFKKVSYRYPDTEQFVVKDLSLKVKAGECIAVVGASGSGKSTIMNLIIGFLMPNEGDILIDGKSIKDFNLSEYRHHISVVPQNSILFSGTIRENITYGLEHYREEDLNRVVEMANLTEFICELPLGLDTPIGEHGGKLSGGQKQRITIARALIRDPRILILDEATSALDNISEYHVQKAIASSIKGRTTFIVAHRLSTIRDADRIVVMEQGVAVETGTFNELMEKKGKFYELKALNEMNLKTAEENLS